jgi:hypothetical protein
MVVLAQTAGSFQPTGSMITPRWGYTATLLPNGKVLIAGGAPPPSNLALSSAELYDPSTGTFSRTGDMITARYGHSATLLPDGRVLIASGTTSTVAEIYDPSTGTFSATGDMIQAGNGTAILLADGRVLIAHDLLRPSYVPAELYDPAKGTFSATGNQPVIWSGHQQASLLPDGRVLLAICCTAEQVYDPASGTFSPTGAMVGICPDGFAMAPLPNGTVLVSGGYCEESNLASLSAALYTPATGTFNPTGQMLQPRYYHTATQLGDGTVLIAGSQAPNASVRFVSSAEVYNPASSTFSPTGDLTIGRSGHTATLLLDGTVLITGGSSGINVGPLASAEIYTPPVRTPAPALFSLSGDGQSQGGVWHATTGQAASADNPAVAGEALSMYTTSLAPGGATPPQVSIGGRLAGILYFGEAPGYPGYYQVNFRVPGSVAPGSNVPVRLTYLGRPSNQVTIAVQ